MKTNKIVLLLLALSMVFAFAWAQFAPKTSVIEEVNKKINEQKKKSDLFMKGVTFSEIVDGVKYWEIKSVTSQINKDTGTAFLKDINGIFFRNGEKAVNFIAPNVSWNMRSKNIIIESPVGFDKNFKFKTSELNWSLSSNNISTDSKIYFETKGLYMKAEGFSADTALESMQLKGHPYAEIKSYGETILIEADSFEVGGRTGQIRAIGDAQAERGGLKIKCEEISFNKNEYKILLKTEVKITFKNIKAESDMAEYDIKSRQLVLWGMARANRSGSTIEGKRLKIDTKNNKITVEGSTKIFVEEETVTKEYR